MTDPYKKDRILFDKVEFEEKLEIKPSLPVPKPPLLQSMLR